jgi:hypothetical protein
MGAALDLAVVNEGRDDFLSKPLGLEEPPKKHSRE